MTARGHRFSWERALIETPGISATAQHVGLVMAMHLGTLGDHVFPRIATIARDARCSVSTVQRSINELRSAGLVEIEYRSGKPSYYHLVAPRSEQVTRATPVTGDTPPRSPMTEPTEQTSEQTVSSLRSETVSKNVRDAIWDALVAGFGEPVTKTEQGAYGRLVKEIGQVLGPIEPSEATAEVESRIREARRRFDGLDFTPFVLTSRWSDLGRQPERRGQNLSSVRGQNLSATPGPITLENMRRQREWRQNAMEAVAQAARDAGRDPEEAVKAWVAENP